MACLTVVLLSGSILGQARTDLAYENHSMMYVPQLSPDQAAEFGRGGFDVVRSLPDGGMEVVAASRDRATLIRQYNAKILIENLEEYYRKGLDPGKAMGGYHTYVEALDELEALHAANPAITLIDTMGYSYEGRVMIAFKISDNAEIDETDEPEVQFNGLIHAREPMGLEICMTTINHMLDNQLDPEIADMINTTEIWFIPFMNPDGYVYNEVTNPYGGGMWRKNRTPNYDGSYGTDLNRNWGFFWGLENNSSFDPTSLLYCGTGPFSEPETQVVRDFFNAHDFVAAVNFHSYGNLYEYPMGAPFIFGCPDNNIFDEMCSYLANITAYNYVTIGGQFGFGGDACCWQYEEQTTKRKVYAILIETATSFWPPVAEMEDHCQRHLQSNLEIIRRAHQFMDHPSRWLSASISCVDTTVTDCSSGFTKTLVLRNTHASTPIAANVTYTDYSPEVPEWCTATVTSGTINPGDSLVMTFDLSPEAMFGLPHNTLIGGHLDVVAIAQDALGTIDILDYQLRMLYSADDSDNDGLVACMEN